MLKKKILKLLFLLTIFVIIIPIIVLMSLIFTINSIIIYGLLIVNISFILISCVNLDKLSKRYIKLLESDVSRENKCYKDDELIDENIMKVDLSINLDNEPVNEYINDMVKLKKKNNSKKN